MKNKLKSSLNIESPKIAIYMRVSTSKQADNQSLDTQEKTITHILRRGMIGLILFAIIMLKVILPH